MTKNCKWLHEEEDGQGRILKLALGPSQLGPSIGILQKCSPTTFLILGGTMHKYGRVHGLGNHQQRKRSRAKW